MDVRWLVLSVLSLAFIVIDYSRAKKKVDNIVVSYCIIIVLCNILGSQFFTHNADLWWRPVMHTVSLNFLANTIFLTVTTGLPVANLAALLLSVSLLF